MSRRATLALLLLLLAGPADRTAAAGPGPYHPSSLRLRGGEGPSTARAWLEASADCGGCHQEIAAQWERSAHHLASLQNPFYLASLRGLRRERGIAASRFCGGCHDPLPLLAGDLDRPTLEPALPRSQAGVVCLVCHGATGIHDRTGNGGLVLDAGGTRPVPMGRGPHGARLRTPLLGTTALCGACHKVGLVEEVTGHRFLRGQNELDAFEQSALGGAGVASVRRPLPGGTDVRRCQDCHMPREHATRPEPAAGADGKVRSHRFLAANSALPFLRGDHQGVEDTARALRDAVTLDLLGYRVAPRPGAESDGSAPLVTLGPGAALPAGTRLVLEVVARNRRVGHAFPGGTADSNEAWLELTLADGQGRVHFRSGALGRQGALEPGAHRFGAVILDEQGDPLLRRDVHRMRAPGYTTAIPPGTAEVVRYALTVPPALEGRALTIRARLLYRKFHRAFTRFACGEAPGAWTRRGCPDLPVLEVARDEVTVGIGQHPGHRHGSHPASPERRGTGARAPASERALDHALGLMRAPAESTSPALAALRALLGSNGGGGSTPATAALALLQSRLGLLAPLRAVEARRPVREPHPLLLWAEAEVLMSTFRHARALAPLETLARRLPRDLAVREALAVSHGVAGHPAAALAHAEAGLAIDPERAALHHARMLAAGELGQPGLARSALAAYLRYREPDQVIELRARLRARHPELAAEHVGLHVHDLLPLRR